MVNNEDFLIYLKIDKSFSKNTILSYNNNLNSFFFYCKSNKMDVLKLEYIDLLNYLTFLKNEKKYKPRSINNVISSLKCYYTFFNFYFVYATAF